ncbi:MAG TPA: SDR family NAD(P)-dependent oxidoreductase [Microthrixaceae bacterium]|nr:SDR family NAD(P)-dependent oxidoreductase [Microthrixaceae bacterium]
MDQFEGKVAVVTGAASGIGEALARAFAAEGMRVVLGDVEADPLAAVVDDLAGSGAEVIGVPVDVSNFDQVDALGAAAVERFGGLHVACNNAGVSAGGLSWELDDATWDWVLGVNLRGVIHGLRAFVPRIVASGGGHIVNTASMAGLTSPPFMSPYNVAKHGVVTLSESLYQELQMTHPEVGVTVLCPGWVRTRIHEAERNRPGGPLEPVVPEGVAMDPSAMRSVIAGLIESGLEPSEVAGMAIQAIRDHRFYVLTHDGWQEMARSRMQRIVDGVNPELSLPSSAT